MAVVSGIEEQQVVSYIMEKWTDWKNARKLKELVWLECIRMFLSKFAPDVEQWLKKNSRSRRYVGHAWDAVEIVHAQLMQMLFPANEWMRFIPSAPGGWTQDDIAAKHMEAAIYHQLRMMRFKRSWKSLSKMVLAIGSCPFSVSWQRKWSMDYPAYADAMQRYDTQNQQEWKVYMAQMQEYQALARAQVAAGTPAEALPPPPSFRQPGPPALNQQIMWEGPALHVDDPFNFLIDPYANEEESALRLKRTSKTLAYLEKFTRYDETGYRVFEDLGGLSEGDINTQEWSSEA